MRGPERVGGARNKCRHHHRKEVRVCVWGGGGGGGGGGERQLERKGPVSTACSSPLMSGRVPWQGTTRQGRCCFGPAP